jgi:hypothetical protein
MFSCISSLTCLRKVCLIHLDIIVLPAPTTTHIHALKIAEATVVTDH